MVRAVITKQEPYRELKIIKQRVTELEARETEYKKTEQALRESEDRLRTMMEASSEGFALQDGDKVFDINENGARMFGCARSEMVGKNAPDFVAPESLELVRKNITANYAQPYEAVFKRKNGSKFPVEIKVRNVTYKGRDVSLVSFRDLTAQRQYRDLLETVVVHAPVSMSVVQNRRFKFVNRQFYRDTGYTEEELLSMDVMQGVYPEDRALVRNSTVQMLSGERTEPFEFRTINKNGDIRWVLQTVTSITHDGQRASLAMYLDITERKLAEAEYKTILQATIDGFWLADMQGRFLDVNDAYCQLIGYNRDELVKMSIPDIEAIEKPEETAERIARIKKVGGDRFETYHRCKDGKIVNVEISVNYIEAGGGRMVVFIRDITERKQAELALRMSEQNLKEAQALGKIGSWEFDLTTQKIGWSDETYRLYERDKTLGPPSPEEEAQYYAPEQTRKLREYALLCAETGKEYNYDLTANLPSGKTLFLNASVRPVKDEQGQVTKLFGTVQDVTGRKRITTELRLREEKLRSIFSTAPVGIGMTADRLMVEINDRLCEITGYDREELLERSPSILYESNDEHEALREQVYEEVAQKGSSSIETRWRQKDGKFIDVLLNAAPVKVPSPSQGIIFTVMDITERKQAEEALKASEENFRNSFDNSPMGSMVFKRDGDIIYANRALLDIYGFSSIEELLNTPVKERYTPEAYAEYLVRFAEFLNGKTEAMDYELSIVRKDGTVRQLQAYRREVTWGGERQYQLRYFDITERKKAEEALKNSEERFRRLAENAQDIIFRYRQLPSLGFDYISPAVLRISGYAPEEFYADPLLLFKVVHPDSRSFLEEITSRPQDYLDKPVVLRWIHKNGEAIWTEQRSVPIYDEDGKIIAIEGIIRDVTERKKAEEILRESEENLQTYLDNAPEGVCLYDLQGVFLYSNKMAEEILGYRKEELIGNSFLSLNILPAKYLAKAGELLAFNATGRVTGPDEFELIKKDGNHTWVEISTTPIKQKERMLIISFVRDINDRKQADEALKGTEENFRNSIANSPMGILIHTQNDEMLYANRTLLNIFGFADFNQFWSMPLYTRYTPESYKEYLIRREKHRKGEASPSEYEVSINRKGGSVRHLKVFRTEVVWNGQKQYQTLYNDITEQKHAQEALRISEENYRNSMDSSPMGVVVFTGDEEILYANQAILDIYGYSSIEELRSTPVKERFTPESYAEYLVRSEKFKSGEVTSLGYGLSIRRKDGGIRNLQALRKEIIWGGEKQFQLLYSDITERKKAEDAMRESRARFRELARLLPLAIWETDANGTLTYTNEEAMRVYGYSRQDTAPSYLQNLIPQDRDRAAGNTERLLQGETLGGIGYTGLRKDGSTFPVMIYSSAIFKNGKGVGLRGITIDTTEQKIAERRLEQAAQEWRTTFDSFTDMVCILDNDFRITRVNRAYANVLKKEPQELLGKACYEMINRDCPHNDCPHEKTLKTGKPAMAEFFEPTLGTYIEVSTSPVFNENGDIKGSVHVMRDISERKQMEQQLMLTDRLASVGELASGVAHELNNPLTSVIGFSQLLIEGEIPDNIREDLNLINSEAQRAASIVKNLLTFARKHAAVKQATKINSLIEDVLKLRAYEQKVNNIEVIKKFTSDLPEIMVDYFQIQQVFLNLIINAEFFMTEEHRRGTLTISIGKVDHAVRISFADDGPGIPMENLNRIFDPFFTTKEVGKGTGLGLSICHGIIAEHGGKISAESEVGKGATFIIELPIDGH
jgi:PAS domain S-box-containing protein